ncbi:MAG: acyltransferase [Thermoleophilaceae bacterium]
MSAGPKGRLARAAVALQYRLGPRLASALRRRLVRLRNPQADIRFGGGCYLGPGFSLHMPHGGTFVAGSGTEFRRGFRAEVAGPDASVRIGAGCYLTYDVIVACSTSIEIGDRVGIGQAGFVVDGSHRYSDLTRPFLDQGYDYRPLKIASDAQIHSKVTVMADIGERAIVGANAVVTRPVPPFTVAAGVPARVIDYYGPPGGEPEGWESTGGESAGREPGLPGDGAAR